MSDDFKKDIGNFLYALMAYIIVKEILPNIKLKDEETYIEIKDDSEE